MGIYELPDVGCWDPKSGPLIGQKGLLTAEPSLRAPGAPSPFKNYYVLLVFIPMMKFSSWHFFCCLLVSLSMGNSLFCSHCLITQHQKSHASFSCL